MLLKNSNMTTLNSPVPGPKPHLRIRPTNGWSALALRETWQFRDLLFSLAGRDLKLRYKQTALGVIWVVLQPLMAAGVFSFVFGKVAKLPSDGKPYFLFSFAGLLGWNLFNNTVAKTSACLTGNSQLISKVFFPRLVLPLSTVPSTMVDFGVSAAMMAVLMIVYGVAPSAALLLLPVWMILLLLLSLGIGLCVAALVGQLPRCSIYPSGLPSDLVVRESDRLFAERGSRQVEGRLPDQPIERPTRSLSLVALVHCAAANGNAGLCIGADGGDVCVWYVSFQAHGAKVRRRDLTLPLATSTFL